jgi:hypothetical protein
MDRFHKVRFLRIVVSIVFVMLCAALVLLWVRCYWLIDMFWGPTATSGQVVVVSMQGQLFVGTNVGGGPAWSRQSGKLYSKWRSIWRTLFPRRDVFGFALVVDSNNVGIAVPHWFAALVTATLAWLPWAPWSKRFSLRTLLVATTLIAVVLGMAIYGIRK